jgi:hypothetical protein
MAEAVEIDMDIVFMGFVIIVLILALFFLGFPISMDEAVRRGAEAIQNCRDPCSYLWI